MNRCPAAGQPLDPHDQAEVDRFTAFLRDPDPDRAAAYRRPTSGAHPVTTTDEVIYGTGTPEDPWRVYARGGNRAGYRGGLGTEPRASCLRCHKNVAVMRDGTLRPHADPTLGPVRGGYGATRAVRCAPTDHLIRSEN